MKLGNVVLYRDEAFDPNFYYFSGVDIDHSFLVILGARKTLLVPRMNEAVAKRQFSGKVLVYNNSFEDLKNLLKGKAICLDYSSLSANVFVRLRKNFKTANCSEELSLARMAKNKKEVEKVAKAAKISKEILSMLDFKKLKTENDVKKFLLMETLKRGLEPAYAPIVATGRNSAFPHYASQNVKLENVILIDFAVKYLGYCADLTRCYFLGKGKKVDEAKKNYQKLKDVFQEIIGRLNSGKLKTSGELAKFSYESVAKHKLPKMIHGIGHGVGLEVHELPRPSEKFTDKLKGTTFAIEPACYFNNKYGLRFEETVYFDGKRARIL